MKKKKKVNKLYADYSSSTLHEKLLLHMGDVYVNTWDYCRAVWDTPKELAIGKAMALERLTLATTKCIMILAEMETR